MAVIKYWYELEEDNKSLCFFWCDAYLTLP